MESSNSVTDVKNKFSVIEQNIETPSIVKRWTIVFACCWVNIAVFAMLKSSGVLYLEILKNFEGSTSSDASWQITLINSISAIASLPAGLLTHWLEIRTIVSAGIIITSAAITTCYFSISILTLNILLGFVQGIGLGLVFGQLPAIITQYFDAKTRAAAVGVSFAGSTIGSIFSPLIFDRLLDSFTLQESCLIMGLIAFTSIIGALLLTPHPKARIQKTLEDDNRISLGLLTKLNEDAQIMVNPHFALICLSYSTHYLSSITIMMALPDFAIKSGLTHKESIILLSFISVGNLLGRLTPLVTRFMKCAKLSDKTTYIISTISLPLIYMMFPVISYLHVEFVVSIFTQFVFLTILIGYLSSFQLVLAPVLLAEKLGSEKTAVTFGLINFVSGLVSFSRPLVIMVISPTENHYDRIFFVFAVFPLISACTWIIEMFVTKFTAPNLSSVAVDP